jgi:hypothetical protein
LQDGLAAPPAGETQGQPLVVVIDGAKEPERVPDSIVIERVMLSLVLAPDAQEETIVLRRLRLDSIGLSASDRSITERVLAELTPVIVANEYAVRSAYDGFTRDPQRAESRAQAQQAFRAREAGAVAGYQRRLEELTPDGATKLRAYLENAKKGITMFGPPDK